MSNILVASLGRSPIVVTSLVKALKEKQEILIDKVILLYPEKARLIKDGVDLIEEHCICGNIEKHSLPFADANTNEFCLQFLQMLHHNVLEKNKSEDIWLSLAGGRKSMSALMSLLAPFYKNIRGIYHILDKHEGTPYENFFTIEELADKYYTDDPELAGIMNPPSDSVKLIKIPFEHFADADDLRKILECAKADKPMNNASLHLDRISSGAREFWASVFTGKNMAHLNEIWFSENAKKQFETGNINKEIFSRYFSESKLMNPEWAGKSDIKNGGRHVSFDGKSIGDRFYIAKISNTAERVAWYKRKDNIIVIAELAIEQNNKQYRRVGANTNIDKSYFSKKSVKDYDPVCKFTEVIKKPELTLVATLGKSPMVVTQAYVLLEYFESIIIKKIALVFPEKNDEIKNCAALLKKVFKKKNVKIEIFGIHIEDINSESACNKFLKQMIQTIDKLQNDEIPVKILLSGGRKGMAALSLLAAQRSNITEIYHTLIKSEKVENEIEKIGRLSELEKLGSVKKKVHKLFLGDYHDRIDNLFSLFKIPIIPFSSK